MRTCSSSTNDDYVLSRGHGTLDSGFFDGDGDEKYCPEAFTAQKATVGMLRVHGPPVS